MELKIPTQTGFKILFGLSVLDVATTLAGFYFFPDVFTDKNPLLLILFSKIGLLAMPLLKAVGFAIYLLIFMYMETEKEGRIVNKASLLLMNGLFLYVVANNFHVLYQLMER
jgi:heme/copper-type cytochrome/quinol oxidase subunit 4